MDNPSSKDFVAEYLALKAANERLREDGKQWLWRVLDLLSSEISRNLGERPGALPLEVGRQEWQFRVESATMVGERYGARYRGQTLVVEAGWPRLPEHGFITDGGLARGRIGLSRNTMLEAQTVAELILKRQGLNDTAWFLIAGRQIGEQLTKARLRSYFHLLLSE